MMATASRVHSAVVHVVKGIHGTKHSNPTLIFDTAAVILFALIARTQELSRAFDVVIGTKSWGQAAFTIPVANYVRGIRH